MRVVELCFPAQLPVNQFPDSSQVVAIGDFDGIHLGHREVIERALQTAKRLHIPCAIMTFHPHPREVLGQEKYARHLTPLKDKLQIFDELGVNYTYVVSFDKAFAEVSPEQFVREMLVSMRVNTIVVGFDFTFGHGGRGNPDTLCTLGKGLFAVEVVRPFHMYGVKVSSTLIREYLETGQIARANQMIGRHYTLAGTVVRGEGRGRLLGFPTANIEPSDAYVIPGNGVYAVKIHFDGKSYDGVMNIGFKPTFASGENNKTLEVHIFDFSGSIYGKTVRIDFISFLRKEQKFGSVDDLVRQIHKDIDESKHILCNIT